MNQSSTLQRWSPSSLTKGEVLGIVNVRFERKFKIRRAWKDAFPTAKYILAEYNSGRFYRAYQMHSTVHRTGDQIITALFFFTNYNRMTNYIHRHNLPTELYHTYTVHRLASTRFAIMDYKIRYNQAEQTGYITLPIENRIIKGTNLRIGDTVNLTLVDQTTNRTHHIALHKILAKEHNYCAIRLTPTATHYFISKYELDNHPLLATRHITLHIEKISLNNQLYSKRHAHVNLAKPALLEHLFQQKPFLNALLEKIGYFDIMDVDIHFLPDGRNRPDLVLKAIKNNQTIQVIGECKACNKQYASQIIKQATIQLLHYKLLKKFKEAHEGLVIITGNPTKPKWEHLLARINELAKKKSSTKYRVHAKKILLEKNATLSQLKDWYENHVEYITSKMMRQTLDDLECQHQIHHGRSILDFIEK